MKKVLRIIGAVLLIVLFAVVTVIGYLTVDEYKPADIEDITIEGKAGDAISLNQENNIMSWNIGYGALGDNADFFMDGGKMVYTADKARVEDNISAIASQIEDINPDILLLQEVDINSSRSYFTDEFATLIKKVNSDVARYQNAFAYNFKVAFVPLPIPPIGKANAGIGYMSAYETASAKRYTLPCPFSWPLRTFNLKRCLQVMRLPVDGSDKELVLINLHLEAYDEGEGKIAQTNMLRDIMQKEADAGNYVIVAGDFNQTFSTTDISAFPLLEGKWEAGTIDTSNFGNDFDFYADSSAPTCRSLDQVLIDAPDRDPQHFQYYVIDGFIVSKNVQVSNVHTFDLGFRNSDHNPVVMSFSLQ